MYGKIWGNFLNNTCQAELDQYGNEGNNIVKADMIQTIYILLYKSIKDLKNGQGNLFKSSWSVL